MRAEWSARAVLRAAAWLVPRERRRSWREEWRAELDYATREGAAPMAMAGGALADAATLRMLSVRRMLSWRSWCRAWHGTGRDVALACRGIASAPGTSLAIVVSLAVGLGASVAGFSALQTLFFRPFPHVQHQDQLLHLCVQREDRNACMASFAEYWQLREHLEADATIAASLRTTAAVKVGDRALSVPATIVSANYFGVLGVTPAQGRLFSAADDAVGLAHPIAVISHDIWQRELDGRPEAAGQLMFINGTAVRVIGVAPRGFVGVTPKRDGYAQGVWLPLSAAEIALRNDAGQPQAASAMPPSFLLRLVARLRPGTNAAQLESQARSIAMSFAPLPAPRPLLPQAPAASTVPSATVHPVFLNDPANAAPAAVAFTGVPTVVLLIACANAALLLVARATRRSGEWRLRMAIGASRWRLVRQLLAEATVLAMAAGVLGLAFAMLLLRLQEQLLPLPVTIDLPVLLFAAAGVAGTALLFGIGPAWSTASGTSAAPGSLGRYRSRTRARTALIAAQATLCVALLASGTQFIRALRANLDGAGIEDPATMLVAEVDLTPLAYTEGATDDFYAELASRLQGLPGVARAGVSTAEYWASGQETSYVDVVVVGEPESSSRAVSASLVTGDLLATLDLGLLRGETLAARASSASVVVNEAFERQVVDGNALGRAVRVRGLAGGRGEALATIVGVVAPPPGTARLDHQAVPHLYYSAPRAGIAPRWIFVRAFDAAQAAESLRSTVGTIDDRVPVDITTLADRLRTNRIDEVWIARSTALLGLLGLFLTVGGLFGVVTFVVALRTPEIGVRLALGASPRAVVRLIVRQAMMPVGLGLIVGSALAYGVGFVVQSRVYGSESLELTALLVGAALLLLPTGVASLIPALRASRIDPNLALRRPD